MNRWLYRLIITTQSEEESLINHLHDGGYSPKTEGGRFEHLARPDKSRGFVLQIDVEDDDHKNAAEVTMDFFTAEILSCIPKRTLGFWCRLGRYTKKRCWGMFSIFFGSFTVLLITLIRVEGNQVILPQADVFFYRLGLSTLPSLAFFIGGLKKLNSRFLSDD